MRSPCVYCAQIVDRPAPARHCHACAKKRHPFVAKAAWMVHRAVSNGDLPHIMSQLCVDCGAPAWEYDHRDYSKPLEVEAACRSCNARRGPAKFPMQVAA